MQSVFQIRENLMNKPTLGHYKLKNQLSVTHALRNTLVLAVVAMVQKIEEENDKTDQMERMTKKMIAEKKMFMGELRYWILK